jgi:hypothetical protein
MGVQMIAKFTEFDFQQARSDTLLTLECKNCQKIFYQAKHYIKIVLQGGQRTKDTLDFCSQSCNVAYRNRGHRLDVVCHPFSEKAKSG